VLRNGLLVAIALLGGAPQVQRSLGPLDSVALLATFAAAVLLYLGAAQLLRNAAAMRAWRNSRG
jgi:hypothetical protein